MAINAFLTGLKDVAASFGNFWLPVLLGWQDIVQSYRRSKIGVFWITINTAIFILCLGIIFGTLFRQNLEEYVPLTCVSLLLWNFINATIMDSCSSFVSSSDMILQVEMPFSVYVMKDMWRNIILFAHNIIIFPLTVFATGGHFELISLVSIFGFGLVVINLLWISLILAVICTRYRDVKQVIASVMQILFYATPILWNIKILPDYIPKQIVVWNPMYNFVEIIRGPLLNEHIDLQFWLAPVAIGVCGWILTLTLLGYYKKRIAYWL